MSKWQTARLGDVCEKVTDYVASGSFASLKENVLITNEENYAVMVKTADFSNGFTKGLTYTDKHGYEFLHNSNLFGGELILSNIGSIGKVFKVPYLDRPMTLASNSVMIKTETDELRNYLYYFFLSDIGYEKLMSISSGTSMKKFNKTELKGLVIPIPPLETQRQIAANLDKVTHTIDLCNAILEKLDLLVKSRFVEMFGDLRLNPKGWQVQNFDELSEIITDGEHATPRRTTHGIYLLSARNVLNHAIQLEDVDFIDQDEYDRISKRIVPREGDVLVSCSGSVGRCCHVPAGLKFQMVRSAALIRFKEEISPLFAEYMITSDYVQEQIEAAKTASSQANLFQGKIAKLRGFVPPLELQYQFAAFVEQTDKSKLAVKQVLEKAETLKKALMQEYFG